MASIYYQINSGYPNFTAHIEPNVAPDQIHSSIGLYSFDNIPAGDYSITITDAIGCEAFFDNINITTTTTTSTTSTTTSTTTTTTTTTSTTSTTTSTTTTTTTTTPIYTAKYGLLYNWYAATDVRNIANVGWSVPDYLKVKTLREYLDPSGTPAINTAGGKLKETGTISWQNPNTGATNEANFNARGSGSRTSFDGSFMGLLVTFKCWITTEYPYNATSAADYMMDYNNGYLIHYVPFDNWFSTPKKNGLSIRLVKDSTDLTHGQTGTYTGNDGKVYRTICIGTQEWLSENLMETKYRNGDAIPEVTDNTAWAALTTGALCAYKNDWNNV